MNKDKVSRIYQNMRKESTESAIDPEKIKLVFDIIARYGGATTAITVFGSIVDSLITGKIISDRDKMRIQKSLTDIHTSQQGVETEGRDPSYPEDNPHGYNRDFEDGPYGDGPESEEDIAAGKADYEFDKRYR